MDLYIYNKKYIYKKWIDKSHMKVKRTGMCFITISGMCFIPMVMSLSIEYVYRHFSFNVIMGKCYSFYIIVCEKNTLFEL